MVSNSARMSLAHETLDVAHLAPHLHTLSKEGITNLENKVLVMKTQALEETELDIGGWPFLCPSNDTMSPPGGQLHEVEGAQASELGRLGFRSFENPLHVSEPQLPGL